MQRVYELHRPARLPYKSTLTELSGVGRPTSFVVLYGDLKRTQESTCVYVIELTQK